MNIKNIAVIGIMVTFCGIIHAADDAQPITFNPHAPAIKKPQDFIRRLGTDQKDIVRSFKDCLAACLVHNSAIADKVARPTKRQYSAIIPTAHDYVQKLSDDAVSDLFDTWKKFYDARLEQQKRATKK